MKDGYIETMWAIHGHCGLYTGTWLTRKDAIYYHVTAKANLPNHSDAAIRLAWKALKSNGDKAVKVKMTYTA